MGNAIWAIIFVFGSAAIGCLGYGAIYGTISATMLEPSFQRGMLFGLTFGMAGGAIIAAFSLHGDRLRGFGTRLVPWLAGGAIVSIAAYGAIWNGGWDILFEGSWGLALCTVSIWTAATAWIVSEITD